MNAPRITESQGTVALVVRLFAYVGRRRRSQFALLFLLTLAGSVAEMVSLGAVVPFVAALTDPAGLFRYRSVQWLAAQLGVTQPEALIAPLTIAFGAAALVAGGLRLLVVWFSIRLGNATGADLSVEVYRRTLYQPYPVHVARSSSEVIAGITQKVGTATSVLIGIAALGTSGMLFVAIVAALLIISPGGATLAMAGFGVGYVVIAWRTRRRLEHNSRVIAGEQTAVVRSLQEGLGAIRDVLLDGTQPVYVASYGRAVRLLQYAHGENTYINQAPRYAMETLAIVLVSVVALALSGEPSALGGALPVLGALGLGAQRLLPLLQQLYGNWAVVAASQGALVDVLRLLDQPLPEDATTPVPPPLPLRRDLQLTGVRFRYGPTLPWVIDGLHLEVRRGERVGLVGTTGSGKSTLLDLLMGLLTPEEGALIVDGDAVVGARRRAWQQAVAHVPQAIYLADATIAENIAFGVPPGEIDHARVRECARQAQIADVIEQRPGGYAALVGERGVRLSGGQRQRIGIARALYRRAVVLVFDEATSALDTDTEDAVLSAIDGLHRDLTILMVAHRLTTLRQCDRILRLEQGRLLAGPPQVEPA